MTSPRTPLSQHGVIRRELLRTDAERTIRAAIMDGRLRPGEVLKDREVQRWLGTSRTPVREAFLALEHAGLLRIEPNRSVSVTTSDAGEARCALQTLGVLMRGIIRTTGQLLSPGRRVVVGMIDDTIARLEHADGRALDRSTSDNYRTWAGLAPNRLLRAVNAHAIDGLAFRIRTGGATAAVPWDHLIRTNRDLRAAIEDGRTEAAVTAIETMHFLPGRSDER